MKFKNLITILTLSVFLLTAYTNNVHAQDAKQMFQKGLMAENGQGDLQEAIKIYEGVVADENAESAVKAKAQLHIGLCYEKLG
jgi:hypothetical protein